MAFPLKPFGVAKRRLGTTLSSEQRSVLVESVAIRGIESALAAGLQVAVVTDDASLGDWAESHGAEAIPEPLEEPPGLDRAARAAQRHARNLGIPWAISHGDLPLVHAGDFNAVVEVLPSGGVVLAPSYDGGTNLVAGDVDEFEFAYGPGSFRRHLAAASGVPTRILIRRGLALDMDTDRDVAVAGLA